MLKIDCMASQKTKYVQALMGSFGEEREVDFYIQFLKKLEAFLLK